MTTLIHEKNIPFFLLENDGHLDGYSVRKTNDLSTTVANTPGIYYAVHTISLDAAIERMEKLMKINTISDLFNLADYLFDPITAKHILELPPIAYNLAKAANYDDSMALKAYKAAIGHDIGKILVPDYILMKPGLLTPEEFALCHLHSHMGYLLLKEIEKRCHLNLAIELEGALHNHEDMNGLGYPDGLYGSQIPLYIQLSRAADIWHALNRDRPYRLCLPPSDSLGIMMEELQEIISYEARHTIYQHGRSILVPRDSISLLKN